MSGVNYKLSLMVAAVMALSAGVLRAALPDKPDLSGPISMMGQLLIATPELHDPNFDHAVILVARHNKDGALGLVINRPFERVEVAQLLAGFGADARGVTGSVQAFIGGPVNPEVGFVLHTAEYHGVDTEDIDGRVALSSGPEILRDIGVGKGPRKSLVAFGYAGWGPSQLDEEIARGFWNAVPEDPALVFDDRRARVWADALARYKPGR